MNNLKIIALADFIYWNSIFYLYAVICVISSLKVIYQPTIIFLKRFIDEIKSLSWSVNIYYINVFKKLIICNIQGDNQYTNLWLKRKRNWTIGFFLLLLNYCYFNDVFHSRIMYSFIITFIAKIIVALLLSDLFVLFLYFLSCSTCINNIIIMNIKQTLELNWRAIENYMITHKL